MTDTTNAPDCLWVDVSRGFNHAEAFDHPCPSDERPDDLDEHLYHHDRKYREALAETERLQAEVSRLREALEQITHWYSKLHLHRPEFDKAKAALAAARGEPKGGE